ncbi:MAG: hypothetical protein MRY74_05275 [Neomegalonema sp.]|nr:hypothetical protein [Neomegalonema sp.]
MFGMSFSRRSAAVLGLLACALSTFKAPDAMVGTAAHAAEYAPSCLDLFERGYRAAPAQAAACEKAMVTAWGAGDLRMIEVYTRIAAEIAGVPKRAPEAIPLRAKAEALALRLHGPDHIETAKMSLAYVQTLILAGRCDGLDPSVRERLDRARKGFVGLPASERREDGIRRVAAAYGDAKIYAPAADLLPLLGDAMTGTDWRLVAEWRKKAGDVTGAEAALRAGVKVSKAPIVRARLIHLLKKSLFERGDFEALSRMPK